MQNIELNNLIIIDIETVSEKNNFQNLDEHWKYLWEEKVKRTLPENTTVSELYEQRAGIMAEFSKIVCISIGYFKKEGGLQLRVKSFYGHEEKELLQNFITTVNQMAAINNKWCFTGHNIKEFDIPFLCRRMLINNLSIPPYLDFQNMKPWETNIVDTFQCWRFGDYKNFTSLNLLAACLGVPSPKDDIDGSMVGKVYWQDKDCSRIAVYCQKDVITVANIILRFKNMPLLTEGQVNISV
jgi:predicted PolB exonuclease-like 3'-5' exonuclease